MKPDHFIYERDEWKAIVSLLTCNLALNGLILDGRRFIRCDMSAKK